MTRNRNRATITLAMFAVTAGLGSAESTDPTVPVFGHRYAITRAHSQGFEAIAFNPDDGTLTSAGYIHDLCGSLVSDGPDESPGVAWDPVTGNWWQLTNDHVVVWNGDAVVDTAFVLEEFLDVPGVGADTLESPRGIALDLTHVYIVDAGPDPGELFSNAWFKFTRDGDPVASSKATDLVDNLDADPDALVDDIVWVPETSPVMPGRLLIALEHSGIQVIDTDGFFVDELLWSSLDLPDGVVPFAFAGLGINADTGDLYLVNNDTNDVQVWTRLGTTSEDVSFAVGKSFDQAYLYDPSVACNRPLLHGFSAGFGDPIPGTFFGLTYRAADGLCYGADLNSGELHAFDPRHGDLFLAGETGVTGIWGLTYDPERDVFYLAQEVPPSIQIYSVDPVDFVATPLVNPTPFHFHDLAYRPGNETIYAVTCFDDPRLIAIERDSGLATVVGPTVCVDGLAYDPLADRLVGTRNGGVDQEDLWAIDPDTGSSEYLGSVENGSPEGLAVVSSPGVTVGVDMPMSPPAATHLRVVPNPFSTETSISLDIGRDVTAIARVFDTSGRVVRVLDRTSASGASWSWDGRTESGHAVSPGIYFADVRSAATRQSVKLVLSR